jgi:glycosyltransferase involved in cell wall biosynthesis
MSIGAPPAPFTSGGGAVQRRVAELAREQARRGHDVTVVAPGDGGGSAVIDDVGVRYVRCRTPAPWMHLEFQARATGRLTRSRPDVVHVHNEPEAGLARWLPTVLSYDNFYFRGGRLAPLIRRSLTSYDALLPVSEYCRAESAGYWRLPAERVHVVPNGVNLDQFAGDEAGAARERAQFDRPVVLYLGRVCRQKGVDTLLDATVRLRELGVNAEVAIAGPIEQFDDADRSGAAADWERRMAAAGARYLGRVDENRLAGLLTMADVFVMPTAELEMQGMAALEAQACGTPVVASDHGGLRETVPDSCGIRFPPGDAEALAQALALMLGDRAAAKRYAAAAREHARELSWQRIVDRLEPIYERVAAR